MLSKAQNPDLMPQKSSQRVALFGGVYSNYLALEALLEDARARGVRRLYCLGDLGAFGPFPDRACQIMREAAIPVVQGNYDNSIGNGLADCQCGYTDPRDNISRRFLTATHFGTRATTTKTGCSNFR